MLLFLFKFNLNFLSLFNLFKKVLKINILSSLDGIFSLRIFRVFFLFLGNVIDLPDSTADSVSFETAAWRLGQNGFLNVINNYPKGSLFCSKKSIKFPAAYIKTTVFI